jgi:excisionase family DNA binding protein
VCKQARATSQCDWVPARLWAGTASNRRAAARPNILVQKMENEWLTVTETAEYLGLSTKTIRNYIRSGRLEAERVGPKLISIHVESLDRLRVPILVTRRYGVSR